MSTQEETNKSMGFGCCQSMMDKCVNSELNKGKATAFDFKDCEQMMKKFCVSKDGKFDFEACRSKIEQFCKSTMKESNDKQSS